MTNSEENNASSWMKSIAITAVIAFIIRIFIFTPVQVSGVSMEPSYEHEDRVVITKIHSIENFDVIVFDAKNADKRYIKRVIGKSGDRLVMEDDQLFINGELYEEPYLTTNKTTVFPGQKLTEDFEIEVPKGYLYVLGDNRRESTDSRMIGFIDEDDVIGEVKFRILPLKRFGIPN